MMHIRLSISPNYKDSERDQFKDLPIRPTDKFSGSVDYHFNVKNEQEFRSEFDIFVMLKNEFEKSFGCDFESYLYLENENDQSETVFYFSRQDLEQLVKFNVNLECKT